MKSSDICISHKDLRIKLIESIANYENDEPSELVSNSIKYESIIEWFQLPHQHKTSVTCLRCLANHYIAKADFILQELLSISKEIPKVSIEELHW